MITYLYFEKKLNLIDIHIVEKFVCVAGIWGRKIYFNYSINVNIKRLVKFLISNFDYGKMGEYNLLGII